MSESGRRFVDHVVMPVETLDGARQTFEALGFTVAPDAVHPFGTGNACVFLADGTYLEPLAVLDRDLAETRAAGGNAFLQRDLSYRLRHPLPGYSGIALLSRNAIVDREAFAASGYDGGELLEFGRLFKMPDGDSLDLSFRLAFATDRLAPAFFVFACQRLFDFTPDRGALTTHANGVVGLARLVFSAREPERHQAFLESTLGSAAIVVNSLGLTLAMANVVADILAPDGLAARYGIADLGEAELRLAGLVFETADVEHVRRLLDAAGLSAIDRPGRLVVPLTPTGAAFLAFERSAG